MQESPGRSSCPKCGLVQAPANECSRCGIVISKYAATHKAPTPAVPQPAAPQPAPLKKRADGLDPVLSGAMNQLLAETARSKAAQAKAQQGNGHSTRVKESKEDTKDGIVAKARALLASLLHAIAG